MKNAAKYIRFLSFSLTTFLLIACLAFLLIQSRWDRSSELDNAAAFKQGTIGTEIMPHPVFVALPGIFPELFQPRGVQGGEWHEQFGMSKEAEGKQEMPTGFFLSNKRPKSGAPSPVEFVGISCVMCHSTEVRKPNGDVQLVVGPGNSSLNLFAWIDAFQTAVLDERLNFDSVKQQYEEKTAKKISFAQKIMIIAWLKQTRKKIREGTQKYGDPFHGKEVFLASNVPTGPGRTQPFRTLVRRLLDRPGTDMRVYTKISSVFHQDRREWAQVDGSIRDLYARSSVAAYAAGATVQNMRHPDIVRNIRSASDFTRNLDAPSFAEMFPELAPDLDGALVKEGRKVYSVHCASCHGYPTNDNNLSKDGWVDGKYHGDIVPYEKIGTDAERVTFRRFEELPEKIVDEFPSGHPFEFSREDIRPGPSGETVGYINAPIERAYLRAPYFHNASVLTLSELINLEKRREVFYRGQNMYDPKRIGLESPNEPTEKIYFRFDTKVQGNSNAGHDYPWQFDSPDRDENALKSLLEYLKTI